MRCAATFVQLGSRQPLQASFRMTATVWAVDLMLLVLGRARWAACFNFFNLIGRVLSEAVEPVPRPSGVASRTYGGASMHRDSSL